MMISKPVLALLAVLASLSLTEGQTIPNANCQCQIILNTNTAFFCQAFTSTMCNNLYCASSITGNCAATGYGAATGTVCGAGRVCQNGQCVASSGVSTTCLYGDSLITQSQAASAFNLQIPSSQMTCSAVISYLFSVGLSPLVYCSITAFQQACCASCQTYNSLSCFDMYPLLCNTNSNQCRNSNYLINNMPIFITCRRTCGYCFQNQLTCNNGLCQNGATCVNVAATNDLLVGFFCQCPTGYSGQFCQLKNPCNPNPCLNGGVCSLVTALSYSCQCQANFFGTNCASFSPPVSNVCSVNICQNGGTCSIVGSVSFCTCPAAFTGNRCQFASGCLTNPCLNGGVCYATPTQAPFFYCTCFNGFTGSNCQIAPAVTTSPCRDFDVQFCPFAKSIGMCTQGFVYQGLPITVYCGVSCGCSNSG